MVYLTAKTSHVYLQWDPSSRFPLPDPGSAPDNCGPTSVTNIAGFYLDRDDLSIYRTRTLGAASYGPTSISEQKQMLIARGVNCFFSQFFDASRITDIVAPGTRPVILGLNMAQVPEEIAGHPFRGWHAVVALKNAERNGVQGKLIRDPNFNHTYRQDPTGGNRFYPDWVIQNAFGNTGGWALVPVQAKPLPLALPDTALRANAPIAQGDPMPKHFRGEIDAQGHCPRRTVEDNKPIRKGFTISSGTYLRTKTRREFSIVGRIEKKDLPRAERQYGDVLITVIYTGSGHAFGYIKQVDIAGN